MTTRRLVIEPEAEAELEEAATLHVLAYMHPRRASLEEIEHIVRQHHGEFRLTRHAEAIEYRKSVAIESGHAPAEVAQPQAGGARVQAVAAG